MSRRLPLLVRTLSKPAPPRHEGDDTDVRREVRERLLTELGGPRFERGPMIDEIRRALTATDAELANATGTSALACKRGCSFCCHVHVDVTPPEVLALAAHLESALDKGGLEDLIERLRDRARRGVEHLGDEARRLNRVPCAVLDAEGACLGHDARPLACRAGHSTNVDPCARAFGLGPDLEGAIDRGAMTDGPPMIEAHVRAAIEVSKGFDEGFAWAGYAMPTQSLEVALLDALDKGIVLGAWLRRE